MGGIALLASAVLVGNPLGAQDAPTPQIVAEDVLSEEPAVLASADADYYGNDPVSAEERALISREVVQAVPDYDPDDPFVIKRVLPIDGPIRYGEWHWDDEGVPDGPLVMTVDLQARVISVFRGGYEIGAAAALLGTETHPTPTGVFPILTKERHNVSEKYNNAPMPWTLRLTWDGIAIHGGSTVELGYASHGCIGVPDEFVSRLYEIAELGDVVIITDGVMTGVGGSLDTNS
ncbi:L,D-transpeptidase [Aurantiacibacter aquimixticola]|uniref:L,D-transpeptidase n=2 Tax=Aurantiacibacter aquimixticola TaxID=1958945 RepID=A0A419RTQ7_9SPHN|nr:L,D-transpeptidase [Aurantiacibacter aquimixticola]